MRYVLVNDAQYGGGGGYFAVHAAGNSSAREIGLHEVGHSFAGLADEYGGFQEMYLGTEPFEINVTTNPAGEKWAEWLGYIDPALGPVGGTVNGQTFVDAGETFNFSAYGFGPGEYTAPAMDSPTCSPAMPATTC
jgi:hypothetical protein